ncbi:hypothetical protein ACFL2E_11360 [Thermodesulfobacteriota bacterium]
MKYKIEIDNQKFEVEVNGDFCDVRLDNFSEVKPGTIAPKPVGLPTAAVAPIAAARPAPKSIKPLAGTFAITAPIETFVPTPNPAKVMPNRFGLAKETSEL